MAMPKLRPSQLPGWPRMLSLELAAAYCGVSPSHFEREVEAGEKPPSTRSGTRKLWDRHILDEWLDRATFRVIADEKHKEQNDVIMRRLQRGPQIRRALDQYRP